MKDDKKKLMVVALLVLVVLGVGAFQFLGHSSGTPTLVVKATPKADAKANDPAAKPDPAVNPKFAVDLPTRDPFKEGILASVDPTPKPTVIPAPHPHVRGGTGGTMPVPIGGTLPNGPISTRPVEVEPTFKVTGVIVGGYKNAAVFTDAQGNQRLVTVGASLDGDTKVVAISKTEVTVNHRGKTLRLTPGREPK